MTTKAAQASKLFDLARAAGDESSAAKHHKDMVRAIRRNYLARLRRAIR